VTPALSLDEAGRLVASIAEAKAVYKVLVFGNDSDRVHSTRLSSCICEVGAAASAMSARLFDSY
jgi:hypothetical protein